MFDELGELAKRKKANLRIAGETENTKEQIKFFKQLDITTTLIEPYAVLVFSMESYKGGDGIKIAYTTKMPLHKIMSYDTIKQAGRDPTDIVDACWEDQLIMRTKWQTIMDKMLFRSFEDIVMGEARAFHKKILKEIRMKEFKVKRSLLLMEKLLKC